MRDEQYVVIGAGHAGGRAVEAMRNSGFNGNIILIGQEPHLPYERPPLSKELLQEGTDYSFPYIRPQEYFDEHNIELRLGVKASKIETITKTILLENGDTVNYDKLLLTMGGHVRKLEIPGDNLSGVQYLRTLDESLNIEAILSKGKRIVVIGGGFIGLELAASARKRDAIVTVIEISDRLMGRSVPPVVSAHFLELHRNRGVDIRLGTAINLIEGNDSIESVVTSTGDRLKADLVVIGVGIAANTELAEEAELDVNNGIVVNEFCLTSEPDIYAAGDVTSHFNPLLGKHIRLESWQCAQNMAIAAAKNMCGQNTPYAEIPWMWSDQFDNNLQVAGLPKSWNNIILHGDSSSGSFIGFILENDIISGAISVNKPRDLRLARRIMSAQKTLTMEELKDEKFSLQELLKR